METSSKDIHPDESSIVDDEGDNDEMSLSESSINSNYQDTGFVRNQDDLDQRKSASNRNIEMLYARRYFDQLGRDVEEKDFYLRKKREELALSCEKIQTLEEQRSNVYSDLEQCQSTDTDRAAASRLSDQHAALLKEIEAELELEAKIKTLIEVAEYNLAKAKVMYGKYALEEEDLEKREFEHMRTKSLIADKRAQSQHKYTKGTIKNYNKRNKQIKDHTNAVELKEAEFVKEAKTCNNQALNFLKLSTARYDHQSKLERDLQSSKMERRMDAVLSLKSNIANNKENLRAIQARDNAFEQMKRQKEDSEIAALIGRGGNAYEKIAEDKHNNQYQLMKQTFLEKQQIEKQHVVKKILKDTDAFLTIKEKAAIPNSKQMIPEFSKKISKKRSDESILAQSNNTARRSKETANNDAEESHILDKPEFEGIWDQHKPFRVQKDLDIKPIIHGGSKMEQEILQDGLLKQKAGLVQKQFAAGKEFKGVAFYSNPTVVHFKDFDLYKTYRKRVVLTNVSYTVNYCKLIGITEHLKDFIKIEFDPPGQMSAGLTCEMMVTFKPMINEDLEGEVTFLAQTGQFSIPLRCTTKKCNVSIDADVIDFGSAVIGETLKRHIILTNSGALGTNYEFFKESAMNPLATSETGTTSLGYETMSDVLDDVATSEDESQMVNREQTNSLIDGEAVTRTVNEQTDIDFLALDGFHIGKLSAGQIKPFSSVSLEIVWQPKVTGKVETDFKLSFSDGATEDLQLSAVAYAIDVPVWVERQSVDLKICLYDRLYQDTVVIHNRATTALLLKFDVVEELSNHIEILPKTGYIQAQSEFYAQLKFLPRKSLPSDSPKYFDAETGVLETPITIRVAQQTEPVVFMVHAVVSSSDMEFDKKDIDFGYCTIHESTKITMNLTNKSLLPQKFGFVRVPNYVTVQPNDGFGTLLPLETVELDLIFSPEKASKFAFELVCKSLINREFKIRCRGVGVQPPLELSHQVLYLSSTKLNDICATDIQVINNHLDMNQYMHSVPRIGEGEIAPVGPTSFEFKVPDGAPLLFSPSVGVVEPGKKQRVIIHFSPRLHDSVIRDEACMIIKEKLAAQSQREYDEMLLKEKEKQEENAKKPSGKQPAKGKASKALQPPAAEQAHSHSIEGPEPVDAPEPSSINSDGDEYAQAHGSLLRTFNGDFHSYIIPCYVGSGKCGKPGELDYNPHNVLYLVVHCPVVKPELVVISDCGRTTADFGHVSQGQHVIKSISIQNITDKIVDLKSTILDTCGPFSLLNALRTLEPDISHTLLISFMPMDTKVYHEVLKIVTANSTLHITLTGRGVAPSVQVSVGNNLDMGAVLVGEYIEKTFKIENTSTLAVDYSLKLESNSLKHYHNSQVIQSTNDPNHFYARGRNNSGMSVFDCVPADGTIRPGEECEIILTFAPDHASQLFIDRMELSLYGQDATHFISLNGSAHDHIMSLEGGEQKYPNIESLSTLPSGGSEDGKAMKTLLVLVNSVVTDDGYDAGESEIYVGCVRTMAVSQKKNGEFILENTAAINAKGFSVEPQKGMIEAGTKKPIVFTWTPRPGHDPNTSVDASIIMTLKGDVTEQFLVMIRGSVVSEI